MSSPEGPKGPKNPEDDRVQKEHAEELRKILSKINRGLGLDEDDRLTLQSELTPEDFIKEEIVRDVISTRNKDTAQFLLDNFSGDISDDDIEELEEIAR